MRNVTRSDRLAKRDTVIRGLLSLFLSVAFAAKSATATGPVEPTEPYVNNAFRTVRLMTSRVVVTVLGRDQDRQLTTYYNEAKQLNFGFPPASMRQHKNERMELFDVDALKPDAREDIRRMTLRHPWHDVYMTTDVMQHVRACYYGSNTNEAVAQNRYICTNPPYVYLEATDVASSDQRYKLRLFLKSATNDNNSPAVPSPVGYAFVSEHTWEIRFRGQLGIVTQALAIATKRVWKESLKMLFEKQIRIFRKRASRFRGRPCSHPVRIRDRLIRSVSVDDFRGDIRDVLRSPRQCSHCPPTSSGVSQYQLARNVPWKEMTSEQKVQVVCCIGHVVCNRLRRTLLDLADSSCLNRRRWAALSEERRIEMIDRHLTVGWLRRKTEADRWLVGMIERQLDVKSTTFIFDDDD